SQITALVLNILNRPDIQEKYRGDQGPQGPQGAPGTNGTTTFNGGGSYTNPIAYFPVGVTTPNSSANFSGGTYATIANFASNIATLTTTNITDANISNLNVTGNTSIGGNLALSGNFVGNINFSGILNLIDPTTGFKATLDLSTLTNDRSLSLPDVDGTILATNTGNTAGNCAEWS